MIFFVSDLHLGVPDKASSRQREDDFCRWLEFAGKEGNEIFILGDIFDFWFEYREVVPKGYVRLLGTIARLTDRGIPITIFRGNHDMWMFGYLEMECGVKIISDELVIVRNEKKFFLHHGDGLGPGDMTYKWIRTLFRSHWAQWLFARFHPNFGMWLGNTLSRRSRISQKNRYEKYLGDDKEHITQFCRQHAEKGPYDFMIFGHRHLALDIEINPRCRYINLGEWVSGRSYAVFDGVKTELKTWE